VTSATYIDTGLTNGATYYYVVTAVNLAGESANSSQVSATPLAQTAVYRIDSGGGAVGTFSADEYFSGADADSTTQNVDTTLVAEAAPEAVYQSVRTGYNFSYSLPGLTPGGTYTVRLHFADFWVSVAGGRLFNVTINGKAALTNFDVYASAGAPYRAAVRDCVAAADSNGKLLLQFTGVNAPALVNGIEVIRFAAPPVSPTALYQIDSGGGAVGTFSADEYFSWADADSTSHSIDTSGVTNAAPEAVYQSVRTAYNFSYSLPGLTPGATYTVRLHFADFWVSVAGGRLFDVSINGTAALTNFDVYANAGAPYRAVVRDCVAVADSNGNLFLQFTGVVGPALVNGIEVLH
jgi:hypothetical protein